MCFEESNNVRNLLELFSVGIEDFDIEFVFESHNEFNTVKGVCTEVITEFRFGLDIFSLDLQLSNDHVRDLLENFFVHFFLHGKKFCPNLIKCC